MEQDKIVVGLDIGTTKISAIVGCANKQDEIEVMGFGQAPAKGGVTGGVVTNIDKTVQAIRTAIQAAEAQANIDIRVVNVGIAGEHIASTFQHGSITREAVEEEITVADVHRLANDMRRIVTPPGMEVIHVLPQAYTVDHAKRIQDPVGMAGVQLGGEFHVVTAQSNAMLNMRKCVARAGLHVDTLVLNPLAASVAVLSEEEKEAGVCLVDIGGGTTNVAVFYEGVLCYLAILPMGSDAITEDIKQGCQVMEHQAVQLKERFGRAVLTPEAKNEVIAIPGLRNRPPKDVSLHTLAAIIQARAEELVEWVDKNLRASGLQDKLGGGIVLTGAGAQLRDIDKLFAYITHYDVRVGQPSEYLAPTTTALQVPAHAVGVGLVLAGYRALDARDERYRRANSAHSLAAASQNKGKRGIFGKLLSRTKGLLIDDYELEGGR